MASPTEKSRGLTFTRRSGPGPPMPVCYRLDQAQRICRGPRATRCHAGSTSLVSGRADKRALEAGDSRRPDVEQFGRWKFILIGLLDADPLDAAGDLPPLRVLDRVEEQTVMRTSNARIDSYGHSEATTVLKIDGWASVTARAHDEHVRRLAPDGFDVLANQWPTAPHAPLVLAGSTALRPCQ